MQDYKMMKVTKGSGRAIIALTRKMARIIFVILNKRTPFNAEMIRKAEKEPQVA